MDIFGECKTCSVLREALEFERARNKELTETLTSLIKPQPVIQQTINPQAIHKPIGITFSRRRAELEKQDRLRAEAEKSPHAARPDKELRGGPATDTSMKQNTVAQLEKELGVIEVSGEKGA